MTSETNAARMALVGYGRMGQLIERMAPTHGFEVVLRLDEFNNASGAGLTKAEFEHVDVAIEFSAPEAAPANLKRLAELGVPAIAGTTGWIGHLAEVAEAVERHGTALVWSPNFSIGVAVFRRVVETAASAFAKEPSYGAWAWEIHHDMKKDAPSGTLAALVEDMRRAGYMRPIDVGSNRAGMHPGTHEIGFDSAADTITIRHAARSREGFALGALKSAQWIRGRKGVFTFEDVLFGGK
jgi:4-hydroxy-tetrahydrodipicolinate reductase